MRVSTLATLIYPKGRLKSWRGLSLFRYGTSSEYAVPGSGACISAWARFLRIMVRTERSMQPGLRKATRREWTPTVGDM